MKCVTIIGTRPQIIKSSVVSIPCDNVIVDTGQHYSPELSSDIRAELSIRNPMYQLQTPARDDSLQLSYLFPRLSAILDSEKPDFVVVYGDTNSALAGALVAKRKNIPLVHIEAGVRNRDKTLMEEQNRVLTGHLADVHFCTTSQEVSNLLAEGIGSGVHMVGDVLADAFFKYVLRSKRVDVPGGFVLLAIHRRENESGLMENLRKNHGWERKKNVVFARHPKMSPIEGALLNRPASYLEMLWLINNAMEIFTDSGGVQREAYWAGVPCTVVRKHNEWAEYGEPGAVEKIERILKEWIDADFSNRR